MSSTILLIFVHWTLGFCVVTEGASILREHLGLAPFSEGNSRGQGCLWIVVSLIILIGGCQS